MKTKIILYLSIILLFMIVSCEKLEFRKDISGNWKSLGSGGGINGGGDVTYFTQLKISKNYSYSVFKNDTLKTSGKYSVLNPDHKSNYYETFYIYFHNSSNQHYALKFPFEESLFVKFYSSDTLVLSEQYADGFNYLFIRSNK